MKPKRIVAAAALLAFSAHAADASIESRLLGATSKCRDMFADEEATRPEEIKDVRNAYVRVAGVYPTCGCHCEATAAAFKTAAGEYRVLAYEEWGCSWASALAGKDWEKVLPENWREEFAPGFGNYDGDAIFSVKARLPRSGTSLELSLVLLPLGMRLHCPSGICAQRSEGEAKTAYTEADEVRKRLAASQQVGFEKLVLEWDRARGRFRVVTRVAAKKRTLAEFESECGHWSPAC